MGVSNLNVLLSFHNRIKLLLDGDGEKKGFPVILFWIVQHIISLFVGNKAMMEEVKIEKTQR